MASISVIIPVYNCEDYIKETIESALSQSYKDIELIVVDDGSIDATEKIVRSFGSRLKYIRQNKNTGPSAARNIGIEHADGKYIAFLDHDDIWMSSKIEKQIKLLESNPDIGLVYSNGYNIGLAGSKMSTLFDIIKPHRGFVFEELLLDNFIATSSVIVRKQVLDKIGMFDIRFFISQDFDLYLRIAERYKIDFVDAPLLKYRVHSDTLSSKKRNLMLEEVISITRFYRNKIGPRNPDLAQRLDKRIAKYMFYIAIWSLCYKKRSEAISQYLDCIKTMAFDWKIVLSSLFFILPRFVSKVLYRRA